MDGPGYIRPPILALPPSPPNIGTPDSGSWVSNPNFTNQVNKLMYLKKYDRDLWTPIIR